MAECCAHPGVEAVRQCSVCGREYCSFCFLQPDSQICQFCETRNRFASPTISTPTCIPVTSGKARTALILSIAGFAGVITCCAGLVVEPIAFIFALKAKKDFRADPQLRGEGMATAAIWVSIAGFFVNILVAALYAAAIIAEIMKDSGGFN